MIESSESINVKLLLNMINDDLFFIESSGATGKVSHSDTVVTTAAII